MKRMIIAAGLLLVATTGWAQTGTRYRGVGYIYFAPSTAGANPVCQFERRSKCFRRWRGRVHL
jgi:hypothetical protein